VGEYEKFISKLPDKRETASGQLAKKKYGWDIVARTPFFKNLGIPGFLAPFPIGGVDEKPLPGGVIQANDLPSC